MLVAGGKYTTYRVMAKDAVDLALGISAKKDRKDRDKDRDREVERPRPTGARRPTQCPCRARWDGVVERALSNAGASQRPAGGRGRVPPLALWNPHTGVAGLDRRPTRTRGATARGEEHLKVEVVYAAASEGALFLTDILARRTRISIGHAIEVSRPRPTRPRWWRRSWVGMTQRWRVRSTSTTAGWRPRCRARRCR